MAELIVDRRIGNDPSEGLDRMIDCCAEGVPAEA